MRLVALAGPPSSGKTSVLLHVVDELGSAGLRCGVAKFDCLSTNDRTVYDAHGVPALCGISHGRCPDHFFATSLPGVFEWGVEQGLDVLFTESAGLCNRCSPYLEGSLAICVVDTLAGMDAPAKIGPLLQHADVAVATKGDIVSQAEREVFAARLGAMARDAQVMSVNGLTGQGCTRLARAVAAAPQTPGVEGVRLRFTMPSSLCSYCLGERRIGQDYQRGNVMSMFDDDLPPLPDDGAGRPGVNAGEPDGEGSRRCAPAAAHRADAHRSSEGTVHAQGRDEAEPERHSVAGAEPASEAASGTHAACDAPCDGEPGIVDRGASRNLDASFEADAEELSLAAAASGADAIPAQNARASLLPHVASITITAGTDKDGNRGTAGDLTVRAGQVVCLMGPTGAGKSRLLDDIECLAQADTPSGRRVLLDGAAPTEDARRDLAGKLVAQLSQNMNYVIDMPVLDFLALHARTRGVAEPQDAAREALACANRLAGEGFSAATPLSQLSGGQSRSLMVADVALLSAAPVVLIDEIENAGLDKWQALELLASRQKIVVMSTHDPALALMGSMRVVIANGAVSQVIVNDGSERAVLEELRAVDARLADLRSRLRAGERVA